jgi:quercetin dioxygenase-like cupin family protein
MVITHPPAHAYPGMPFDLRPAGESLSEAATVPLVKQETFEAIRMVIHKGQTMPEHRVEGAITIYCLDGRLAFTARGKTHDLKAGHWLYLLGNEPHSLCGIEDSSVLLTILFPRSREERQAEGAIPKTEQ